MATAAAFGADPFGGALAIDIDSNAVSSPTPWPAMERCGASGWRRVSAARASVDEADRGWPLPKASGWGTFIYPSLTETIAYDSNIYGLAQEPIAELAVHHNADTDHPVAAAAACF